MMGRTHALTGWCAGLAVAPLLGLGTVHEAVVFATATAGFALVPDLDHPHATATRMFGPITRVASWLLQRASALAYRIIRGPNDCARRTGTHRHLSHTVLFALALGAATAACTKAGGPIAVVVVVGVGVLLAAHALGDWLVLVAAGAGVGWWLTTANDVPVQLDQLAGWLGIAVALGCVTHNLGDAITESGCPLLWPIRIRGERWYELRPPAALRIRTGKAAENFPRRPDVHHPRRRPDPRRAPSADKPHRSNHMTTPRATALPDPFNRASHEAANAPSAGTAQPAKGTHP